MTVEMSSNREWSVGSNSGDGFGHRMLVRTSWGRRCG